VDEFTDFLVAENPDVVGIQESFVHHPWHNNQDLHVLINQFLDQKGSDLQYYKSSGRIYHPGHPNLRLLVLSKYPINNYRELSCAGGQPCAMAQTFRIDTEPYHFRFYNYHGIAGSACETLAVLADDMGQYPGSTIIGLGDYNLRNTNPDFMQCIQDELYSQGFRNVCDESNDPSCWISVNIAYHDPAAVDYVMIKDGPNELTTVTARNYDINEEITVSDHLPIIAELSHD